ncbi:MAG: prepilin-type N-terminal cleavage/methylation domain-containing protein [Fimbriimonas sp.]|nr:prepilin-type N-terminal cleavage/methylation domain-containing protein [Fimbriimonas sp.]
MHRKAFTLIELLVVIAIIAILAAILFPVFAQAKLAAKKTAALSGVKQLDLAIIMYTGDTDGQFPLGFEGSSQDSGHTWVGTDLWAQRVQPYTKSIGVFEASADSFAGQAPLVGTWAGVGISFGVNSYYGNWCCSPNWNSGFQLRGPMGVGNNSYPDGHNDEGNGWLMNSSLNESALTQPAATILAAQKNGADIAQWNTAYGSKWGCSFNCQGNWSNFAMGGTIGGPNIDVTNNVGGWGPQAIPNAKSTFYSSMGNGNPLQYEFGVNGAVSASYSGQSVFAYVDGHAKSLIPSTTNPDPVNQPQNNQWDGLR